MADTVYLNIGLSDNLLEYITTTYPDVVITERGINHVIIDVSALAQADQSAMRNDIHAKLVEWI